MTGLCKIFNGTHHLLECQNDLRRQLTVLKVAGSNSADFIDFHFIFFIASRSIELGETFTNDIKHEIH